METQRALKVWQVGSGIHGFKMVAATSQKRAAELLGIRIQALAKFGIKVADPDMVALAVANADRVLEAPGGLITYSAGDFQA